MCVKIFNTKHYYITNFFRCLCGVCARVHNTMVMMVSHYHCIVRSWCVGGCVFVHMWCTHGEHTIIIIHVHVLGYAATGIVLVDRYYNAVKPNNTSVSEPLLLNF